MQITVTIDIQETHSWMSDISFTEADIICAVRFGIKLQIHSLVRKLLDIRGPLPKDINDQVRQITAGVTVKQVAA